MLFYQSMGIQIDLSGWVNFRLTFTMSEYFLLVRSSLSSQLYLVEIKGNRHQMDFTLLGTVPAVQRPFSVNVLARSLGKRQVQYDHV